MADSRFAHSQWETVLLCSDVSHWLGEISLVLHIDTTNITEIDICPLILIPILQYPPHRYISISCLSGFAQSILQKNTANTKNTASKNDNYHVEYNFIYIESNGNIHLLTTFFQHFWSHSLWYNSRVSPFPLPGCDLCFASVTVGMSLWHALTQARDRRGRGGGGHSFSEGDR